MSLEKRMVRAAVEALENTKAKAVSFQGTHLLIEVDESEMERNEVQQMLDDIEKKIEFY